MATRKRTPNPAAAAVDDITAILGGDNEVTIGGKVYPLRRLNITDTLRLAQIMGIGATALGRDLALTGANMAQEVVMLLLAGLPYAEQKVIEFIASVVGLTIEQVRDPEVFPMGSELLVIDALVRHTDIQSFFATLQLVMVRAGMGGLGANGSPSLPSPSSDNSNSSNGATGGQTTSS